MKKIILFPLLGVLLYSCTPQETPNAFKDKRDGKVYKTVTIGEQTWMAENLAYLLEVSGEEAGSETEPHYYVHGYNGTDIATAKAEASYKTYGVLYNWPAALTACPDGWHLPSNAEWTQLENYLADNEHNYDGTTGGGRLKIGKSLASESGWNSSSGEGTIGNTDYSAYRNKSGFSALPGGRRLGYGVFSGTGRYGLWWSSTENYADYAWYRALFENDIGVLIGDTNKSVGNSVRCIRD